MDIFKNLLRSAIIAGCIVLLTGLYFQVIGAGIPYQEPTTEMMIKWSANYMAGSLCLRIGAVTLALGTTGSLIIKILKRKKNILIIYPSGFISTGRNILTHQLNLPVIQDFT